MADEVATYADDGSGSEFSAQDAAAELSQRRVKEAPLTEVTFRDGRSAPESLTTREAGEALGEYRIGDASDAAANRPIDEVKYPDDPKYETRSARSASLDLADFRAARAALAAQLDGQPAEAAPPTAEPSTEQPAEPAADQQQPQFSADLLAQAAELVNSEKPEERATAADLLSRASQQAAVEKQAVTDTLWGLEHRTGQAYGQAVGELQNKLGSLLISTFGPAVLADPQQLAQSNPQAYELLKTWGQTYNALNQQSQAQQRATQDLQARQFDSWGRQQDAMASKAIPEASDPNFQALVPKVLMDDYGFQANELGAAYAGAAFSLRDARVQRLIADGIKYRQATKSTSQPVRKALPPVQRPGVSQPYAPAERQDLRGMEGRLTRSGNLKDAASLLVARRSRS